MGHYGAFIILLLMIDATRRNHVTLDGFRWKSLKEINLQK